MENPPRVRNVNLLYLFSMILVVSLGSLAQGLSLNWGLVVTEFFLILGPALLFVLISRKSPRELLRLRWPGLRTMLLCLVLGAAIWPLAALLDIISSLVFQYSPAIPPELYPRTWPAAIALLLNLTISAPICEEVLFRGLLLRAYERYGAWLGITLSGLLFAFYHMRLQGVVALIPVALVLGYVVWRADSLFAGMAVHLSYNLIGGLYLVAASMRPDMPIGGLPLVAMLPGLIVTAGVLWRLHRATIPASPPSPTRARMPHLREMWPLLLAACIYVLAAGAEFALGVVPEVFAFGQSVDLPASTWQAPKEWRYELRTELNEPAGSAHCGLTPEVQWISLKCRTEYDLGDTLNRLWLKPSGESRLDVRWRPDDLTILTADGWQIDGGRETSLRLTANMEGGLDLWKTTHGEDAELMDLPANTLLAGEWPWRVGTLAPNATYVRRATIVGPTVQSLFGLSQDPPAQAGHLLVYGAEPVAAPAGNFIAWRVTAGEQTAWFDIDDPETVVQFDDGHLIWALSEVE